MQHAYTALTPSLFGLPAFGAASAFKTYAPSPVWTGSQRQPVRFVAIGRKEAHATYRKLRAWNRVKVKGRYGGQLGSAALRVFEALVFDFLNHRTGRLDPSYEGIAAKTGLSRSTVAEALKRLKALRIIAWARRCTAVNDPGKGFRLEQETNAYAVLPASGWLGYVDVPAPTLHPSEWGAAPIMPDTISQAVADSRGGGGMVAMLRTLAADPGDPLAAALARLGQAMPTPKA